MHSTPPQNGPREPAAWVHARVSAVLCSSAGRGEHCFQRGFLAQKPSSHALHLAMLKMHKIDNKGLFVHFSSQ